MGLTFWELLQAILEKDRLAVKREKLHKKFGKRIEVAVLGFKGFLEEFSGLADLIKQADSEFGGIAYSVLSTFLVVRKIS